MGRPKSVTSFETPGVFVKRDLTNELAGIDQKGEISGLNGGQMTIGDSVAGNDDDDDSDE